MSLAKQLSTISTNANQKSSNCPIGVILDGLDDEDRKALESALASSASTRSIHNVLRAEGLRVTRDTVTFHRKGFCRCGGGSRD